MWRGFCEHFKECGRNGTLFVLAFGTVLVTAPLGIYGMVALLGLLAVVALRVAGEIAAQRNRHERLGRMPPLSDNDLRAARARLTNHRAARSR